MGEAALCFTLKVWALGGCQVGFHCTQCKLCKWYYWWASEGYLRERGGSTGAHRGTTCHRQCLVMSSKLVLHDHRNLIYYPLTCCHSIFSSRYPFTQLLNQHLVPTVCQASHVRKTLLLHKHKHSKNTVAIFFLPIISVREVCHFSKWQDYPLDQDNTELKKFVSGMRKNRAIVSCWEPFQKLPPGVGCFPDDQHGKHTVLQQLSND